MPADHLFRHDRYIRSVFSHLSVAQEFFEKNLPAEVVNLMDFATLTPQKDSFINDKFRVKVADLLFSVNFSGTLGYVYLLTEHTSSPDRFLPYRMLHYIMGIMDQHRKKHPKAKKLPLIVPLILYTGPKPYAHSTDLFDLFGEEKELSKSVFLNPYQLIDLNAISDESLRETYYLFSAAALATKHIRNMDLVSLTETMIDLLQRLKAEGLNEYAHLTLSYVFDEGNGKDEEGFRRVVRAGLSQEDEEKVMTLREKYLQQGREEGEARGEARGEAKLRDTALNLFRFGMGVEQVAQATTLPLQEVQNLWKKETESH
jgi:predicted transposase/invertase (TIGR01784 family)